MLDRATLPNEFARIINCSQCTTQTCKNLLRDSEENVPQPGFLGIRYEAKRVLMVGQNPAITKSERALAADQPYTALLRKLRDDPTEGTLRSLLAVARDFMPSWRVHQDYFPLQECGLALDELAYINIVRCRTARFDQRKGKLDDTRPNSNVAKQCVESHFTGWVDRLDPRVIIFLGKYAYDYGSPIAKKKNIPCDYLNRQRSRGAELRTADRNRVAKLVRAIVSQ